MEKSYEFKAKVEALHEGQIARYDDTVYEYIITSENKPQTVKHFCLTFIKPARLTKEQFENPQAPGDRFASYYEFKYLGDNRYWYRVVEPYCD